MRKRAHLVQEWLQASHGWLQVGLDLLFPIQCAGCGDAGAVWCASCDQQLVRIRPPICRQCGLNLGRPGPCPSCQRQVPSLQVRSHARYTGRLASALIHLKYRPDERLAQHMAGWLAKLARRESWVATAVVPVPLAKSRMRRRGFNQARLLSEHLARSLNLPNLSGRLKRVEETRSQVGLIPSERWANVRKAFEAAPEAFAGQRVLLVDDLMTTGATLSACADALRRAGARRVWGLTVGRA